MTELTSEGFSSSPARISSILYLVDLCLTGEDSACSAVATGRLVMNPAGGLGAVATQQPGSEAR